MKRGGGIAGQGMQQEEEGGMKKFLTTRKARLPPAATHMVSVMNTRTTIMLGGREGRREGGREGGKEGKRGRRKRLKCVFRDM